MELMELMGLNRLPDVMLPSRFDVPLLMVPVLEDALEIDSKASALSKTFPENILN